MGRLDWLDEVVAELRRFGGRRLRRGKHGDVWRLGGATLSLPSSPGRQPRQGYLALVRRLVRRQGLPPVEPGE